MGAGRFYSCHNGLVIDGPVWGLLPPSGEFLYGVNLYGGARSWSGASLGLLYRLKIKDVVNEATLFWADWLAGCPRTAQEREGLDFLRSIRAWRAIALLLACKGLLIHRRHVG